MSFEKVDLGAAVDIGQMTGRRIAEAFNYGIDNDIVYGGVLSDRVPQALEEISTTQNYLIGSLRVTKPPLVRKYRYCLSSGRCDTFIGNVFCNSISAGGAGADDVGIDWSALAASAAIGDTSIVMTNQGGHAIAEDDLVGGLLVMNPSSGTNNHLIQMRAITANTAGGTTDEITITFDRPLIRALNLGVAYAYCMSSPYNNVKGAQVIGDAGKYSFVGYAAAEIAVSGIFHWEQTAGPISASLYGSGVGKTAYFRDVVFRYDGNLINRTGTGADGDEGQRAGYIMDNNNADNGATMIMLQLEG